MAVGTLLCFIGLIASMATYLVCEPSPDRWPIAIAVFSAAAFALLIYCIRCALRYHDGAYVFGWFLGTFGLSIVFHWLVLFPFFLVGRSVGPPSAIAAGVLAGTGVVYLCLREWQHLRAYNRKKMSHNNPLQDTSQ